MMSGYRRGLWVFLLMATAGIAAVAALAGGMIAGSVTPLARRRRVPQERRRARMPRCERCLRRKRLIGIAGTLTHSCAAIGTHPKQRLLELPEFRADGKQCWITTTKIIRTAQQWGIWILASLKLRRLGTTQR